MSFGGGQGGKVQREKASFCFGRGTRQELLLC